MGTRIHGAYNTRLRLVVIMILIAHAYTAYFVGMGLPEEEASALHHKYYSQYGLAIRGLVRHHQIGASHASNAVQVPVCD